MPGGAGGHVPTPALTGPTPLDDRICQTEQVPARNPLRTFHLKFRSADARRLGLS